MPPIAAKKNASSANERVNLRTPLPTIEALHKQGSAIRKSVPREAHGQWEPADKREDVVSIIRKSNIGRQQHLIPLRMQRMVGSPFAYLRGAAAVMAYDLAKTPTRRSAASRVSQS
jgi:hypothetical protein